MNTGELIKIYDCDFCGYEVFRGLFHTCSTAPKISNPIMIIDELRRNASSENHQEAELSQGAEKRFYKRVMKTEL